MLGQDQIAQCAPDGIVVGLQCHIFGAGIDAEQAVQVRKDSCDCSSHIVIYPPMNTLLLP